MNESASREAIVGIDEEVFDASFVSPQSKQRHH